MTTYVTTQCPRCKVNATVAVPTDGLRAWKGGMLIQHALPTLTPTQREQLITGMCQRCWDEMFKEEEA